jgi:thiamine pyrophosphokinase
MSASYASHTQEKEARYTIIFANGAPPDPETVRQHAEKAHLVLAADGGTHHALALDLVPDVVIGDLDSLSQSHQNRLRSQGTALVVRPAAKDETDLELALIYAVEHAAEPIIILAAMGGRLDQAIANVLLLTMPLLQGRDVRLVEGPQTAFVIGSEATIRGKRGDTVSLIPLGGTAGGVTTEGLLYPLADGTLPFVPALGVSNEMTGDRAWVRVRDGLLLCVHISQPEKDRMEENAPREV